MITAEQHEELAGELPSYSDMIDFVKTLRKAANIPGSQIFILDNIQQVLEQAAILITSGDLEAENALNEILR